MDQDITALKQSFEEEYKTFLETAQRGSREIRQGELFHKYKQLELSANDMAKIIQAVDRETQDKTSKLESYVRRVGNCIKEFEKRSSENLEQENINESVEETVETVAAEQSEESSTADSAKSKTEIQLDALRDKINEQDQDITNNVLEIGEMLIQAKACVEELKKTKKFKKIKWQDWLDRNIKMPRSTASRYIKCTERFKDVAPAQHFDPSKMTVAKMFELLSLSEENFKQFLEDVKEKDIKIQDMSKNELRDFIKNWKKTNIVSDKKTKQKFTVRLSIVEEDRTRFTEFLEWLFERKDLSEDSLKSVDAAIKLLTMSNTTEIGDTESRGSEE